MLFRIHPRVTENGPLPVKLQGESTENIFILYAIAHRVADCQTFYTDDKFYPKNNSIPREKVGEIHIICDCRQSNVHQMFTRCPSRENPTNVQKRAIIAGNVHYTSVVFDNSNI